MGLQGSAPRGTPQWRGAPLRSIAVPAANGASRRALPSTETALFGGGGARSPRQSRPASVGQLRAEARIEPTVAVATDTQRRWRVASRTFVSWSGAGFAEASTHRSPSTHPLRTTVDRTQVRDLPAPPTLRRRPPPPPPRLPRRDPPRRHFAAVLSTTRAGRRRRPPQSIRERGGTRPSLSSPLAARHISRIPAVNLTLNFFLLSPTTPGPASRVKLLFYFPQATASRPNRMPTWKSNFVRPVRTPNHLKQLNNTTANS